VLYSIFTGQSPQKSSLRPQPADQAAVENRYAEILSLDFSSEPTLAWDLQHLLHRGASRQITTIEAFLTGLNQVAVEFGWNPPSSKAVRAEARAHLRTGLAQLRQGHDLIAASRDAIREAAILDEIGDDLEAELKRLLLKINEMLAARVLP
jgi:hypothetical protein